MAAREKPGPPMTSGNMRRNGVRALMATCQACGHKADVNVDVLAATIFDPEAGRRLRCSQCGGKRIDTRQRGIRGDLEQKKPRALEAQGEGGASGRKRTWRGSKDTYLRTQ
jgi:hypothetical protein